MKRMMMRMMKTTKMTRMKMKLKVDSCCLKSYWFYFVALYSFLFIFFF
jgi:hypothetical protein